MNLIFKNPTLEADFALSQNFQTLSVGKGLTVFFHWIYNNNVMIGASRI